MKRSGWNPTRRNRNIGTARSGHGDGERFAIPESWKDPRVYWEKLRKSVRVEAGGLKVLVEPCSPGFVHAVTVDDALRILSFFPPDDVEVIRTLVLRQPTQKQRLFSRVWGRLAYFTNLGDVEGPAVIIEAQRPEGQFEWPHSLRPEDTDEIEHLRQDGHEITRGRRSWMIRTRLESVRATQLYRTIPHEVGHYVQYDREVRRPGAGSPTEFRRLQDAYFSAPTREREDFARRYAREFFELRVREGRIPFERLVEEPRMKQQGLMPAWFGLESH